MYTKKTIPFAKMHSLGNDFVIIDCVSQPWRPDTRNIQAMADRHCGIGCDQLLLLTTTPDTTTDFGCRIFNADGSEVAQCGNGVRCLAYYIRKMGLSKKNTLRLATQRGVLIANFIYQCPPSVNIGIPQLGSPINLPQFPDGITALANPIDLGNPHLVLRVITLAGLDISSYARPLQDHPAFVRQGGVNVVFMQIDHKQQIQLRVFERGVGETLSCGSGACAAVVAASHQGGLLDTSVQVVFCKGSLWVDWAGFQQPIWLSGTTSMVFSGKWFQT